MSYSLLSRYQGAFYATALARGTMDCLQCASPLERTRQSLDGWVTIDPSYENNLTLPGAIVEALIQNGQVGVHRYCDDGRCQPGSELELWMALLPIALFFHEDGEKLRQVLGKLATALQLPSTFVDRSSVLGYAISRVLDDTLDPATLIPQILCDLTSIDAESDLGQQLATVQTLLDRGASLEETRILLTRGRSAHPQRFTEDCYSIALAFYCFLSTPEDLQLSLLRSWRLQDRSSSPLVAVLTGALSGTYNAYAGIPVQWRMTTNDGIGQLSLRLYAAWAGVCDASQATSEWGLPAVGAPRRSLIVNR